MTGNRRWRALGLMSGTSLDGIDAALIETDGRAHVAFGAARTVPYAPALRERLRGALGGRGEMAALERALTEAHAEIVERLADPTGSVARQVDVIGFHGHTILHQPRRRRTWQIGDGALLARLTGIDVVNDFRQADIEAGGQGAPLAPVFHAAISHELPRPLAVLNLGGVANVTWVGDRPETLVAFDTGPGNALIDDWVRERTGQPCDRDGGLAGAGRVHEVALAALLDDAYFTRPPPKSLDRNAFDAGPLAGLTAADGAATLSAFTARSVALAAGHFPSPVVRWVVTGGGRRNPVLMAMLKRFVDAELVPAEAVGWDGDALEAQAFGYLAVRSLKGLALSFPGTTGVAAPLTGGVLHPAGNNRRRDA